MAVTASLEDESDSGLRLLNRRHAPSGKRHRMLRISQADRQQELTSDPVIVALMLERPQPRRRYRQERE